MRNLYFSDYNVSIYKKTVQTPPVYHWSTDLHQAEACMSSAGRFQAGPAELLPAAEAVVLGKGPVPTDTSRSGGLLELVLCYVSECLKRGREGESKLL